jgi:glycosyltransferase involved in cell wall biosynthesis
MENKKVSIVVPIYNVEHYIDRCIDTLVRQTHYNLEIILVDDGSTDNSGDKCDNWEKLDQRIKVIHKKNGGLSSARNAGLEVATGDYIMFEDSDDWVELELVQKCVDRIRKDESDIVIFGYRKVDENDKNIGEFTFGNETYSKEEIVEQLHRRIVEMSFGYAWNKLYDLSVLRESGIKSNCNIVDREDLVFNMQLLNYVNKISYLELVGYNYLQRRTSLLHNSNLARLKNINIFCDTIKSIDLGNTYVQHRVYSMNALYYLSDCMIKNILWNKGLNYKEKVQWMEEVIAKYPYKEYLIKDEENPRHIQILYHSIKRGKVKPFYRYVKLSDIKRKVLRKK